MGHIRQQVLSQGFVKVSGTHGWDIFMKKTKTSGTGKAFVAVSKDGKHRLAHDTTYARCEGAAYYQLCRNE